MGNYKALKNNIFQSGQYKIVPLRDEDKYDIMQWRNEQIYHLRQNKHLTKAEQDNYFKNIVNKLFDEDKPNQILFSYLESDVCIGYGGLVHINWFDKHAEISFIINTVLEKGYFEFHWLIYLKLIEKVAFNDLGLHKIFTLAFDLRPQLYPILEKAGFVREGTLKEHYYWNDKFIDAVVHIKIDEFLRFRRANIGDIHTYFNWLNDDQVRLQSYRSAIVSFDDHSNWFNHKLNDENCYLYIFENNAGEPVGQIRIEKEPNKIAKISISVAQQYRGKGFAPKMLKKAANDFLYENNEYLIEAYIKSANTKSIKAFTEGGFRFEKSLVYEGSDSLLYIFKKTN